MNVLLEKAREWLRSRKLAYQRLFLGHGVDTDIVLQDLAKFCRAHESTFHDPKSGFPLDARLSALMEGRREVWLRIAHHLHLSDEQLWDLYGNKSLTKE